MSILRSFLVAILLLLSFQVTADIKSIIAESMGGASKAVADHPGAMFYNPAAISPVKMYKGALSYIINLQQSGDHNINISIVDSQTADLGVGISYNLHLLSHNDKTQYGHHVIMALSYPIVMEHIFLGINGKYVKNSAQKISSFGGDAGILASITEGVNLAFVGYNLIAQDYLVHQRSIGSGFSVDIAKIIGQTKNDTGDLLLAFDWDWILPKENIGDKHSIKAGLQYSFTESFALRGGYGWKKHNNAHHISVGAGFLSPQASFDILYKQGVKNDQSKFLGFVLNMSV